MSSNPRNKDTIRNSEFDQIFKDRIRDYFTYGYKSYEQSFRSRSSLDNDWTLLRKTLGNDWEFRSQKNGRRAIRLKTPESGSENPLDQLYFRHSLSGKSYFADCLCLMMGMDPETFLPDGYPEWMHPDRWEKLRDLWFPGIGIPEETDIRQKIRAVWILELKKESLYMEPNAYTMLLRSVHRIRTSEQLAVLVPRIWKSSDSVSILDESRRSALRNRTNLLEAHGLIGNLKYTPGRKNQWLDIIRDIYRDLYYREDMPENTLLQTPVNSTSTQAPACTDAPIMDAGINYWYLSALTMRALIQTGAGMSATQDFLTVFYDFCDFFSQYYILGEIGTVLRRRLDFVMPQKPFSAVHIRHNYPQKSLYDYNLIDLLAAIEYDGIKDENEPCICRIRCTHGTHQRISEFIVRPLEIRISVTNGREYLMAYDVDREEICALRLEFMDEIQFLPEDCRIQYVRTDLKRNVIEHKHDLKIDYAQIRQNEDIARQMLPYIWGTETTDCIVDDAWKSRLKTYRITVSCHQAEPHIAERLTRELRGLHVMSEAEGHVITIRCFPTKEIRTWVRSFYMRIIKADGMDDADFSVASDVESMQNVCRAAEPVCEESPVQRTADPDALHYEYIVSGNDSPDAEGAQQMAISLASEGHAALFHEFFSEYAIALANAVLSASGDESPDLSDALRKNLSALFPDCGTNAKNRRQMEDCAEDFLKKACESGLYTEELPQFATFQCDYLYDFLPLTKIECRWLLTALQDPAAGIFFDKDTRGRLASFITEKSPARITPLPTDAIRYYDRFNKTTSDGMFIPGHRFSGFSDAEIRYTGMAYKSIRTEKCLQILYSDVRGTKSDLMIRPTGIEYSRRDNFFRITCPYMKGDVCEERKRNLPRVLHAALSDRPYDLMEAVSSVQSYKDAQSTQLTVIFTEDSRNTADRILTEFSSWKKNCLYDPDTEKYEMTLFYERSEWLEILVRLMSYGPHIKLLPGVNETSGQSSIYVEMEKRLEMQAALFGLPQL